jgi:(2R)-ethylmalonyl-CoA mutase
MESGDQRIVGVNILTEHEPSPLTENLGEAIMRVNPAVEQQAIDSLQAWRVDRDADSVEQALARLAGDAASDRNLMEASLACARAGVTTGEWAQALRSVFGEYRAPTGVTGTVGAGHRAALEPVRLAVEETSRELGTRLRLLVAKPGLDGHSNGAEQVAVAARDAGFEVIYQGIRLTPQDIVSAAAQEDVHCIGLSILSGSHLQLVPEILEGLNAAGMADVPVVLGGIIPDDDAQALIELGVAAVFTPKDFDLTQIMAEIVGIIRARQVAGTAQVPGTTQISANRSTPA